MNTQLSLPPAQTSLSPRENLALVCEEYLSLFLGPSALTARIVVFTCALGEAGPSASSPLATQAYISPTLGTVLTTSASQGNRWLTEALTQKAEGLTHASSLLAVLFLVPRQVFNDQVNC